MDYSKIFIKEACPTSIGGQAIMEGIMMQGPDRIALALRLPSNEIYLRTKKKKPVKKIMKVPFVRGVVAFINSLVVGTSTLMESADILAEYTEDDENVEPGKLETWLTNKFGDKVVWNILLTCSVVFSLLISIGAFVIFPTWAVNFCNKFISSAIILNLIEGILRIAMFIGYVVLIRKMNDIMTIFRYHGAEHKTIHCFENNLELTPENAQQFYTLHPRCGTSFIVFVLIISLLIFSFLGWPNFLLRTISRLLLLPVIAGISFEVLKLAGKTDNKLVRILSYPGLMLQKLTTAEPTLDQLEVAIVALKAVLVDPDKEDFDGIIEK